MYRININITLTLYYLENYSNSCCTTNWNEDHSVNRAANLIMTLSQKLLHCTKITVTRLH